MKYEVTLTPKLDAARKQLFGIAEDLARRQIEMGLKEIDPKEYVKELVHDGMMEACYEWARGVPFVAITKLTGKLDPDALSGIDNSFCPFDMQL